MENPLEKPEATPEDPDPKPRPYPETPVPHHHLQGGVEPGTLSITFSAGHI